MSGEFPAPFVSGSAAPQLKPVPVEKPKAMAAAAAVTAPPVQAPLFQERPANPGLHLAEPRTPARPRASAPKKPKGVSENQATLDFVAAPPAPKKLGTTVDAVIFCDAPVAATMHRAIAAAIDWSMVLIACGLFLTVFRFFGGPIVLSKPNVPFYGAMLGMIAFSYGMLWSLAATETLGMRATKLRLITFDGFPPEPRHRALRFVGSCLSYCTVLGLAWSLADEESLTWQDHISRTFPTYLELDKQTFRQR